MTENDFDISRTKIGDSSLKGEPAVEEVRETKNPDPSVFPSELKSQLAKYLTPRVEDFDFEDPYDLSSLSYLLDWLRAGDQETVEIKTQNFYQTLESQLDSNSSARINTNLLFFLGEISRTPAFTGMPQSLVYKIVNQLVSDDFESEFNGLLTREGKRDAYYSHMVIQALERLAVDKRDFDMINESKNIKPPTYPYNPELAGQPILKASTRVLKPNDRIANPSVGMHYKNFIELMYTKAGWSSASEYLATGESGGVLAENRFIFRNILESYKNRIKLDNYDIPSTVGQITALTPGYLALYARDNLKSIISIEHLNQKSASETLIENELLRDKAQNHQAPIYQSLKQIVDQTSTQTENDKASLNNQQLEKSLTVFWDFIKTNSGFFFDVDYLVELGLDPKIFHPRIISEIIIHNENILKTKIKSPQLKNIEQPVSVLTDKIFPYEEKDLKYLIAEYKFLLSPSMRYRVEEEFGIDLAKLPGYSQSQFARFINNADPAYFLNSSVQIKDIKDKTLRNKIATAFFACAENPEYSKTIIKLLQQSTKTEGFGVENLENILDKYQEIVEKSLDIEKFFYENFKSDINYSRELVRNAALDLQNRANELLKKFASGKVKDVQKALGEIKINVELLGVGFQHMKTARLVEGIEPGGLLNEMKHSHVAVMKASELTDELRGAIRERIIQNREGEYALEHLQSRIDEINKFMEPNSSSEFVIQFFNPDSVDMSEVTQAKNVTTVMRFDPMEGSGNEFYFASFNVDKHLRNRGVGTAVFMGELQKRRDAKIHLAVYSGKQPLVGYYESLGFKVVRHVPNFHNSGKEYVWMTKEPDIKAS